MNTLGKLLTAVVSLLVLLAGLACSNESDGKELSTSGSADSATSPPASSAPSGSEPVSEEPTGGEESAEIIDTDFRPVKLVVPAGTAVTWEQVGDQPHSVSSSDQIFDSSPKCSPTASEMCLGEGEDFAFTFEKPGTFEYYCRVHGLPDGTGMTGTVVVQ